MAFLNIAGVTCFGHSKPSFEGDPGPGEYEFYHDANGNTGVITGTQDGHTFTELSHFPTNDRFGVRSNPTFGEAALRLAQTSNQVVDANGET